MSYEDEIICQETDEKEQVENLNVIMQLLLQQYHDFVDRKERLENKALGHLTPLSIFMAATVAILIMLTQTDNKGLSFIFFMLSFCGQVYFSILTFFYALKAYSVKTSLYPDIKKHSLEWKMKENCFLGKMNNAFIEIIDELNKVLDKLIHDVEMCRIYLTFSMVFGIVNIVIFIMYVINNL